LNLAVVTLGTLALPLFIFFAFWLKTPIAIIAVTALAYGLSQAVILVQPLFAPARDLSPAMRRTRGAAMLLVFFWVLLSGAGGFSSQSLDYGMHNGRLKDLIDYYWPVVYPGNKPLVYYIGYYLPVAWIGKVIGVGLANRLMLFWTAFLVWLACRWLFIGLGKASIGVWLRFMFFSGMSVIGSLLYGFSDYPVDRMEWWAFKEIYISFQSMTFQLFWAPHQVIVGWILMAFLFCLHRKQCYAPMPFIWTLSFFWAPFISLGTAPYLLVSLMRQYKASGLRAIFSRLNLISTLYLGILAAYYMSGSATKNPHGWIWDRFTVIDLDHGVRLLMFYFLEFGGMLLLCWPMVSRLKEADRDYVACAVALLFLMPLYYYGKWNDLLARGIVPSLWMLFWIFESALSALTRRDDRMRRWALLTVYGIGVITSYPSYRQTFLVFGQRQSPISAPDYSLAYQFLGDRNHFFFRYLAK